MKKALGAVLLCFAMSTNGMSQSKIEIESSNLQLVKTFEWAKEKAYSFVQTGKKGPVDIYKVDQESEIVDYIPSYWAGYPLRTAFYSRDFCHQALGAHLLGLQEENFTMLKAFAESANANRKWYPLWAINFDGSPYKLDYRGDDDFVREVPAAFELVEKGYMLYTWTGDKRYIEDNTLWNYYTKIVTEFIELHDNILPNGIAEGSGTGSIFKGTATFNEGRDVPLVEAGDGLATQYKAFWTYAKMAEARGEADLADKFFEKAEALKKYFNEEWGVKGTSMYNRGYDAKGNPIDGWGKENSWFMPMKGLLDPTSNRTIKYLDFINERLESKDDIPENVEALSYIPETFFLHSQNERGWRWMKHIIETVDDVHAQSTLTGTNGNYPEVSYVLISNVVENLAGVRCDGLRVETASHLPREIADLKVRGIQVGDEEIEVAHYGVQRTVVSKKGGKERITWRAKFIGDYSSLYVDGNKISAKKESDQGITYSYVDVDLVNGKKIEVTVSK